MSRTTLALAVATLLVAPTSWAASGATLTIYAAGDDALFSGTATSGALAVGHALVHETRGIRLAAGPQTLRLGNLPATLDPEAIAVGFGPGAAVSILGQRVQLANADARGVLDGAIGSEVSVSTDARGDTALGPQFSGVLLGVSDSGLLLRRPDGQVHFVHQYASVGLPTDAVTAGDTLVLDVAAPVAGQREARLTYTTAGLGWRAAYKATLAAGGSCRMQFQPEASIANRSGRDYAMASIRLVAGQPNLGGRDGIRLRTLAAPAPMAAAMPTAATLGDYRSYTLPGAVSLPNGTVTLTPLYPPEELACTRQYLLEDGSAYAPPHPRTSEYAVAEYRQRAITSTLAFTAPAALPAGMLRAWSNPHDGTPALLGEGRVADTPKGQRVAVPLGESFDLRAIRERTAFHVDATAHTMRETYRITLTNGGSETRTVTLREHPDRWREWKLIRSSSKPMQQTPQLLEFSVPVPTAGAATLDYTVEYQWAAKDL